MSQRRCEGVNASGEPCRAHPLRDHRYCFLHSPEHAEAASEARRIGGQRRRRESALAGAYELEGAATLDGLGRLIEIAVTDTLVLENSLERNRVLLSAVHAGVRYVSVSDLAERIEALEAAVRARR